MPIIEILFLTVIACFSFSLIAYIVGRYLERKEEIKSQVAYLIACVFVAIGVICGFFVMGLDMYQEHTTEYVECERCGSRVPAAEYKIGE